MYKLIMGFDGNLAPCVIRIEDNVAIPFAEDNTSYQKYLAWVAEGNTPEPADE